MGIQFEILQKKTQTAEYQHYRAKSAVRQTPTDRAMAKATYAMASVAQKSAKVS